MDPDNYQQAWQADKALLNVTIDAERLQQEVQSSQKAFQSMIFWRDFREISIAAVMVPGWIGMGIALSLPWTWYLTVLALLWVIGFMLMDRKRHPQTPIESGEPLLHCVQISLTQLEHQIWLLRNVFWWYLLPFSISLMAFFIQTAWDMSITYFEFPIVVFFFGGILLYFYRGIYLLNQLAIRKQLEPRRQELLSLLVSLSDEETVTNQNSHGMASTKPNQSELKGILDVVFQYTDRFIRLALNGTFRLLKRTAFRKLPEERQQELSEPFTSFVDELIGYEADEKKVADNETAVDHQQVNSAHSQGEKRTKISWLVYLVLLLLILGGLVLAVLKSRFGETIPTMRPATFEEAAKLGADAFVRRDFDQAIKNWNEAIRLNPNHSEARRWRGDGWLNKKQYDKALADYDQSLQIDPQNARAYCSRGAVWTEKGQPEKAIADLDEAIRHDATISNLEFYQRYRKAAESVRRLAPVTPEQ